MKNAPKLSQAEMVLLAIYRVSSGTIKRVPFEEIVLRAWRDFPKHFSLNNYPEYPDAYPVSKRLSSDLVTSRLVTSVSKEVYRLTYKGLDNAKELEERLSNSQIERSSTKNILNREEADLIRYATRSRAFLTWKQGKKDDLIDYDVRVFFQFSTGTPVRERKRKIENMREAFEKAIELGLPEAEPLNDLLQFIVKKFSTLFEEG
jgi:hypothetical protein